MSRRNRLKTSRPRRGSKLGVIVEEHLEYRSPEEIEWILFPTGYERAGAYCAPDTKKWLNDIDFQSRRTFTSPENKAVLARFVQTVESEFKELQKAGVSGQIPVCILPHKRSPKRIKNPASMESYIKHERFHARVRRAIQRAGVDTTGFEYTTFLMDFNKAFLADFGEEGRLAEKIGLEGRWGGPAVIVEEILARTEEMIKSCTLDSFEACQVEARSLRSQVRQFNQKNGTSVPTDIFDKIADKILIKYGTAIDYAEDLIKRVEKRELDKPVRPRPPKGQGVPMEYNVWEEGYGQKAPEEPKPARTRRTVRPRRPTAPIVSSGSAGVLDPDDTEPAWLNPDGLPKLRGLALFGGR